MTRQMYESLGVMDLKGIARNRGLKLPSKAKKAEIIDLMVALDEQESSAAAASAAPAPAPAAAEAQAPFVAESAPEMTSGQETPAAEVPAREPATTDRRASGQQGRREQRRPGRRKVVEIAGRKAPRAHAAAAEAAPVATEPVIEDVSVLEEPATASTAALAGTPAASVTPSAQSAPAPAQTASAAQSGTPQNSALDDRYARRGLVRPDQTIAHKNDLNKDLDSGEMANGILEVMADGFGFIRSTNYMPGEDDIYVAPSQIRRFNLKTGDIIQGNIRIKTQNEKFSALLFVKSVNGLDPEIAKRRYNFEDMTPIFPNERIRLEKNGASVAMRVMDLMCPVGKGQRGMIVSPPKAGKTTLVKEIARSVKYNNPEIHLIILLIDERPEEVTDIKEAIEGPNVEVIYSTFDELPEHHKRVSEMVIERAKRLVEQKRDVMILLDSITRLTRAYNLTEPSSGRTLTGGLDPAALHMPKRFFGAARNMREGGSLTILATALIETGSKMDDVVYEEFKGTGNMEMILNRKLQERRIFPAVDLAASGTRRDDLLLTPDEREAADIIHRAFIGARAEQATDSVLDLFSKTRNNGEFVMMVKKRQWAY